MSFRIADKWYERRRVSDDTTLIYEPHVHPFLRCNIWHVRGRDADLLVDTGLGAASLKSSIEDLIDKPLIAVATHIHYDHVGCLHEFDHRLMHAIEAPRMTDYQEFCWLKVMDFPAVFHDALRTDAFEDYLISALPNANFDPDSHAITSTCVTRLVEEGSVVDLGDKHFEVFHLPGHSPGSIGLYRHDNHILFSGDALYDGELLDELPDSSIEDYIKTMNRLRSLPVEIVHGGHEPSFGRVRMIELIDDYLASRA